MEIVVDDFGMLINFAVLDPRIGYKGLLLDHKQEDDLLALINSPKEELQVHYDIYCSSKSVLPSTASIVPRPGSPVKNDYSHYTARYSCRPTDSRNEL